jgi:hypothetical protein
MDKNCKSIILFKYLNNIIKREYEYREPFTIIIITKI